MIAAGIEDRLVGAFPVFAEMREAARHSFLASARYLAVPAGGVLFDEGSRCGAFPLLLKGSVKVTKTSSDGREMVLYRILPGQLCLLTTSCLLGKASYPARGAAEENCELVLAEPGSFHGLLGEQEAFRRLVFGLFSERVTELMELVEEVAFKQLDRRLAALLATRGGAIHASHQVLADELGSVRVVVSRLLRDFEERGWVALGREQIRVVDAAALGTFAEGGVC
jgi:CRP/FNR family transcriptional regulator, anaerobic regulatory protein